MSPQTQPATNPIGRASGPNGVVASGHPLATTAAVEMLRDGGSAVDAALAAAAVLVVTCPYATSLGGDVTMLIFDQREGRVLGLNGTGRAPEAAGLATFPDGVPRDGISTVTVPGFVAGLAAAQARCGTRDLATLLQPAIAHARRGIPVHPVLARNIAMKADLLSRDGAASEIFLPGGSPPAAGDALVQADLADSLQAIADEGPDVFYQGAIANRLHAACQTPGGLLTKADLATHLSLWQEPLTAPFHSHDVVVMPPNSYGLTLLLQLVELGAAGIARIDPASVAFVRRGLAARRLAYRETAGLIADPESTADSARALLQQITTGRPHFSAADSAADEVVDGGTTGVAAMDGAGNAVCLLQSISAPFGAGIVADGTGIVLNNRMRGFVVDPASSNCVAPGRRPAHTLSPCMVLADGQPLLCIGTPGAIGQTSTLAQVLARSLACGEDLATAIAAPRWSVDFDGRPIVEAAMSERVRTALAADEPGLQVKPTGWQSFGSIKAVMAESGTFIGLADGRRAASAAAY